MHCSQYRHENASDVKFCNQCAAPLAPVCVACGHNNTADAKFCNQCGTSLITPPSAASSVPPMPQAADAESRFYALIPDIMGLLRSEGRLTYRRLKHAFSLDEALLEEIRRELVFRQVARDERGEGLVWRGEPPIAALAAAV